MLILILSLITSSVLVFGYLLIYSVQHTEQTSSAWGYDSSDISVEIYNKPSFSQEEFIRTLKSDNRINNYAFNYMTNAVSIVPAGAEMSQQGESSLSLNTSIFDGSYDEMGYSVLKGRNPRYEDEVAIGANVAAKLKLELGDTIQIYVLGKEHQLIVTGIYQAIANMSLSLRMMVGAVDTTTLDLVSFINVKESSYLDDVVSDINAQYENILTAVSMQTLLDSVYTEAVNLLLLPMGLLGLLFITVTALVVYSICRINIRKDSKTYGIYKSLGMTTNKIRSSIAVGMISFTMIGSIIGVFVGVYGMPLLLKSTLSSYGILELPILINWGGISIIVLVMIVAMFMGSWFSSRMIQSTSPRLLVVE
ncbi:FtsX-like permease family protein [compost metagenome]